MWCDVLPTKEMTVRDAQQDQEEDEEEEESSGCEIQDGRGETEGDAGDIRHSDKLSSTKLFRNIF